MENDCNKLMQMVKVNWGSNINIAGLSDKGAFDALDKQDDVFDTFWCE